MNISDLKLSRIFFQEKFHTLYELTDDKLLVVNNLYVYVVKDGWCQSRVDFDIFTGSEGKRYISPRYNPLDCDFFLLLGERLAMCRTLEIKADEYISQYCRDRNFTFAFEENK